MIYISHLIEDTQIREIIRKKGTGVESIEFSIAENLDCLDEKIQKYGERLGNMGDPQLSLHGPFLDLNPMTYDSLIREVTERRYEQVYEAACRLHAKKLVFHTCLVPDAYLLIGWAERMADFFCRFLEGKEGPVVVLENVFDRIPDSMVKVAERVNRPDFQLCLDIGHAFCYSEIPVEDWADCFGTFLNHVHVHDNTGNKDRHMALGDGKIPLDKVWRVIGKYNPRTDYVIECDSMEKVEKSLEVLEGILEK
ncbi:MAG: sugar phosphate isomerase/epimerase family protein [Blautia sp.]